MVGSAYCGEAGTAGSVGLDATAYDNARQTAFNDFLTKLRTDYKVQTYDTWKNMVPTDPAVPASPQ